MSVARCVQAKEKSKCQKIVSLVGCMFLIVPSGIAWYWGSMSVYALSFVALYHHNSPAELEAPWIISLFYITWTVSLIFSSYIAKLFDRRIILLFGSTLINVAIFSSYWAIQNSLTTLDFCMGAMTGLSSGLIYGSAIEIVIETAENDVGFLTSVLQASYSIGSLIIVQLMTWYVNTQNEAPNLIMGSIKYFTQTAVVDNVPSMFLVLGMFTLVTNVIGLTLLQVNPTVRFCYCFCNGSQDSRKPVLSFENADTDYKACSYHSSVETDLDCPKESSSEKGKLEDYTPFQMVRTAKFLALWISFAIADFPFILLTNFYKLFGQVWINDDHFLTDTGTGFIFVTSLSRIPWGLALDRCGPKHCMTALSASIVLTATWYYFTPMVDKWLYLFATLVYGSFAGALYSCYLGATALIFGKTYVATNFGLLMSSSIIFNVFAPTLISTLLAKFGWFAIFAGAGGSNIVSLVLCLLFVP